MTLNKIIANGALGIASMGAGIVASVTSHMTAWLGVYAAIVGGIAGTFAALNGYMEYRRRRREEAKAAAEEAAKKGN